MTAELIAAQAVANFVNVCTTGVALVIVREVIDQIRYWLR